MTKSEMCFTRYNSSKCANKKTPTQLIIVIVEHKPSIPSIKLKAFTLKNIIKPRSIIKFIFILNHNFF